MLFKYKLPFFISYGQPIKQKNTLRGVLLFYMDCKESNQLFVGSNPQPEFKTKKSRHKGDLFCFGSDCRIILAALISRRSLPCGNRHTPVCLSLVVEPTPRWFSSRHLVAIKKPPKREVFFIGSDCRIRTNDQSVNSRLLYR